MIFGNPERADVQISPDGKYLSWLAPSDGVLNVWVVKAGDDPAHAKAVTADRTRPVRTYQWTYDGAHLVYLQDKGGDENFHLHRVDVASGETLDLTPIEGARVMYVRTSERKPQTLLIGINDRDPRVFDLHAIDLGTGKRTLVMQNDQNFVGYEIDHDLTVRFADRMEPDGAMSTLAYDAKTKSWKDYDKVGADDALTTGVIGFDKRGLSYFQRDSRDRDTSGLYKVDAKTKKRSLIYEDARADIGEEVLLHPTEHSVRAVLVEYDRPRWVAVDKRVEKDLAALAKLGEGVPFVVSSTLDDKTWIVKLRGDRASAKFFRWDRSTQTGTFLFSARPKLDKYPLSAMQPVVIPSRDQLPLVSYLTLPKDADADGDGKADRPLPLVLLVHGGPWGRDTWGYDADHQLLANRGYATLSVNFRGSTGFGKRFINAGNLEWGKKMHDDLLDGVDWAVAQGVTTRDKVCIMGGSYGGYATLAGLTRTPDTFACGVDLVGPSNIVTLMETIPPYWKPMLAVFYSRVGNPTTEEGKRALLEVSPLTHAGNIKRPLLIAQGKNDPRVKKSESDQIVEALKSKQIPVSYVVFPDEGHGFARPENSIAFSAVAEAFLSVHLGGFYEPITVERAERVVALDRARARVAAGSAQGPRRRDPAVRARSSVTLPL